MYSQYTSQQTYIRWEKCPHPKKAINITNRLEFGRTWQSRKLTESNVRGKDIFFFHFLSGIKIDSQFRMSCEILAFFNTLMECCDDGKCINIEYVTHQLASWIENMPFFLGKNEGKTKPLKKLQQNNYKAFGFDSS